MSTSTWHMARNRGQENGAWWGDVDDDGVSEWIAEVNGNSYPETQIYCLTMNGKFPADAWWPEYFHAAYPAEYQAEQDWLKSKLTYSNSLFFPISEAGIIIAAGLLLARLLRIISAFSS